MKDRKTEFQSHIIPFFWQHGETDEKILEEIKAICDSDIKALCIESRPHEEFCQAGWWDDMNLILSRCKELGMKVWILDDKHFPSGYSNGILKEKDMRFRKWEITERHVDVLGPINQGSVIVPFKNELNLEEILAVCACERDTEGESLTGRIINISEQMNEGLVSFNLPQGLWRIIFIAKTRRFISGRNSLYCDPLSKESVNEFIQEVYEKHYANLSVYFGNTLNAFFSDEPSFGNNDRSDSICLGQRYGRYPWTDEVYEILKEKCGEGTITMLPGLWYPSDRKKMSSIRLAYMETITKLYEQNFSIQIGEWCYNHGVSYLGHIVEDDNAHSRTGYSAGHYFRSMSGQDYSGVDVVLHQIIPGIIHHITATKAAYQVIDPDFFNYVLAKLGSSYANIDKKKTGRAMCEVFGAYGWAEGTKIMKYIIDHMLVRGINYFVPHAFSPKYPDKDCPPHFYAEGHNPEYRGFACLMDYTEQMCGVLSDGKQKASALILYQAEAEWSGAHYMPMQEVAKTIMDCQINFDFISEDYLAELEVKSGKISINGLEYSCILIPYSECLPASILRELSRIEKNGGNVAFISDYPEYCPEEENIDYIKSCKKSSLESLPQYIDEIGGIDLRLSKDNPYIRFLHIEKNNKQIYMLMNENVKETAFEKIHIAGFNGGSYVLKNYLEKTKRVFNSVDGEIEVELEPYQTTIIYLSEISSPHVEENIEYDNLPLGHLNYKISLADADDLHTFKDYKVTDTLENITALNNRPHFSGNIRYNANFCIENIKQQYKYIMDLGKCGEVVEVFVNKVNVGMKIVPPYTFDITSAISKGENKIEIIVSNNLAWKMRDTYSEYLVLEPSGLLGPVRLIGEKWE